MISLTGPEYYRLLPDGNVEPCTFMEWAEWFENADAQRIVAQQRVGGCLVSTVFLGMNDQWGEGPPLIFETMTFRPRGGEFSCARCSTLEQARNLHAATVAALRRTYRRHPHVLLSHMLQRAWHVTVLWWKFGRRHA